MILFRHAGLTYRHLEVETGDHEAAVALQSTVWDAASATPRNNLIAAQHCGGIVIGAFADDDRRCAGFTYGFAAFDGRRTWLHSHQTAVRADLRGSGVGATLKWLQRDEAVRLGYDRISWTFDPLVARNAAFNLSLLGATASRYEADLYGPMDDPMNRGLPTDRLWVDWELHADRVEAAFHRYRGGFPEVCRSGPGVQGRNDTTRVAPVLVLAADEEGRPGEPLLDEAADALAVEIPTDAAALKRSAPDSARAWRLAVRRVFVSYLARGYVTTEMERSPDRACYRLHRTKDEAQ